jgi:hypothetical protein
MTNNKQQTAIEWFLIECGKYGDTAQIPDEVIDQAKEMHKTEHFNTWWHSISENEPITFHQYYNETFGGAEQ